MASGWLLAAIGMGIVIRKIPAEERNLMLLRPPSSLNSSERELRKILTEGGRHCKGIDDEYSRKVIGGIEPYELNDLYLAFTLFPKQRTTAKGAKKPKPSYRFVGLVTVGPFRGEDSTGYRHVFVDKKIQAMVPRMRDIDLVCVDDAYAPPMAATVLMANVIAEDLKAHRDAVYTLERSLREEEAPVDGVAAKLGFVRVGIVYPEIGSMVESLARMVSVDPMYHIRRNMPNEFETTTIDEICTKDKCLI